MVRDVHGVLTSPAALVALIGVLAAATRVLPESDVTWVVRVAGAIVLVAVIPGTAVLLAWLRSRSVGLLELLGFSIAISFALVQALTVAVLMLHWSPVHALSALAAVTIAQLAFALRGSAETVRIQITRAECVVAALLGVLALFLYATGSPIRDQEDRVHIAIVRRLAALASPALDNIYLSPGVVYTYPFPGTHYMMALMSRVGDIDPLFLYQKLRAFWGVASIALLYGVALVMFRSRQIALATALTAAAFVANGTFASVPGMYWAQMAPYSHAADVAMGVLLPALLLLSLAFLQAAELRDKIFFFVTALGMAFMVIVVHPREIVQLAVYLSAFSAALLLGHGPRAPLLGRTVTLLVAVCGVLLVYRWWYQSAVALVDTLVADRRRDLWDLLAGSSWNALLGQPLPLLDDYMPGFNLMFHSWIPAVLLVTPVALYVLRGHRMTWLIGASIIAYLAIIRLPIFAMFYAYLTYFEILYTPVRNVVFFVYLLAGVSLYLLAAWIARYRNVALVCLTLVASGSIVVLFGWTGALASRHPDVLFIPVVLGCAAALIAARRSEAVRGGGADWPDAPNRQWGLAFGMLLLPIAAATWAPASAVVHASWSNSVPTPAALMAGLECRDEGQFCPPSSSLLQFVRDRVPVNAVFAVDYREAYEPSLFMPQQVVVWSGAIEGLVEPRRYFPVYFRHLEQARDASLDQPFFNDRETRAERVAFIRELEVTHVLVNPRLYAAMKPVLARDTDLFVPLFDDGQWALYGVNL